MSNRAMPFLSAENGKVRGWYFSDLFGEPDITGAPEEVAAWLIEIGHSSWMSSSSMDFGTEYGFDTDNVRDLVYEAGVKILEMEA